MQWISYHTKNIKDKYLFRFIYKRYLFNFLETGSIWFSRADQFGDKMECVRIMDLQQEKPDYQKFEHRKKRFLISCWHLATKESLALWDTYASLPENRRLLGIRFRREELEQQIQNNIFRNNEFYYRTKWVHGRVLYKDLINVKADALNRSRIKYPAFRKEAAFKYENEYRFVVQLNKPTEKLGYAYNIGNPQKLCFDILINPLLKKEDYLPLKAELEDKGFADKIKPSSLSKWLQPEMW